METLAPCTRAVLGIDAAWTASEPSGVASLTQSSGRWRLVAAEASYARFHARADGLSGGRPLGSRPRPSALLASALKLCGSPVDFVAIDMPLSNSPIMGRRRADDEVSRAYGAQPHRPSPDAVRRKPAFGPEA
jgi:hypothetical protein